MGTEPSPDGRGKNDRPLGITSDQTAGLLFFLAALLFTDEARALTTLSPAVHALISVVLFGWAVYLSFPTIKTFGSALLRRERPAWTRLANFLILALMIAVLVALAPKRETTTPENVEENVRRWLDNFKVSATKNYSESGYFSLIATMHSGNSVTIARLKNYDRYIVLLAELSASQEYQDAFSKLPDNEKSRIYRELLIEVGRSKIIFSTITPLVFRFQKRIPITNALTEDVLITAMDELDSNILLIKESVKRLLEMASPLETR